ncbi:alpha/beta fold hydrolase [Indiicoccus explosivorum]|uniref:alpha/beta fold hydrolase n=1 Tax=Indiicoccus explosivorum TaxID=1917864 RepID=UPI000B444E1B|nr:alpha/beta hydrolase [Indiicoccus explosivorum]
MKTNQNGTVFYEHGHPESPALVCLHGLAGSSRYSFSSLIRQLEDDFQLFLFDSPGHGGTPPFSEPEAYRFSSLAGWYEELFARCVPGSFFLLGHSWGADVALHYASRYPDRVEGLILLDGAFTFPHNQPEMTRKTALEGWADYMDSAVYPDWDAVMADFRQYTVKWNRDREADVKSLFEETEGGLRLTVPKQAVLAIIEAFFDEPFTDAYPRLSMPVLLLHAEEPRELDAARASGITQMEAAIPDVTIQRIEGAGHLLMWDAPEETAEKISRWTKMKEGPAESQNPLHQD